jgi:activator of 2-hydroxyglutaryl-CoA dehydratase/predicted nucleotide-binding protein (sugar kinase/HSP70/actin superfamily)
MTRDWIEEASMAERYVGIDIGAETIKWVELERHGAELRWTRRELCEHHKAPERLLPELLGRSAWHGVTSAAATGRLSRPFVLPRIPEKQARAAGFRLLHPESGPVTLVSVGGHGFSVLELREGELEIFRENSRCSQGTGNFLRQLVERFGLGIEEASALCAGVEDPAPLSGRCPVILKTDMTHLANQGQSRARILAGLYDAVAESVQALVKPRLCPPRVALLGGLSRSERIRAHFRRYLEKNGMELCELGEDDALFIDAVGCAVLAADGPRATLPALDRLVGTDGTRAVERVPPLSSALSRVRRMQRGRESLDAAPEPGRAGQALVLGFDIGSTGSKVVALDVTTREPVWQAYVGTAGNPVAAARRLAADFVASPWAQGRVLGLGATGSGREIVGSLLSSCFGPERVFVLNEIAAHAAGALHYDQRVDTIFEIGGQDAKYIRLGEGRVVDAAMNEACSAGTGSFIEEQGRRFSGIRDVVQLGEVALAADSGISLGQHCSVFMAEIIDEAVAAGVDQGAIVAGIYDAVIQNYLHRVKGPRSVGRVVFCQGMPFASDALAAAAARQTGAEIVVPPSPGTVGALGIALLTCKERLDDVAVPTAAAEAGLDLERLLTAEVVSRETFVCQSIHGCGGSGNKCRIDRLRTRVGGDARSFSWGGGCSLYDRATGKKKLPDGTPDPFREREELVAELVRQLAPAAGRPTLALTDEFLLQGLFPLFATFFHELGFALQIQRGADQRILKRGIEQANVPFCAPMQQYHGLASTMLERQPDLLFLPMIRSLPRVAGEERSSLCPIVQASADMVRADLASAASATRILSPVIDVGHAGLHSPELVSSLGTLAAELGFEPRRWRPAFDRAVEAQRGFDRRCDELGRRALDFCRDHALTPIVVLGRGYTIYNRVLNSNVPAIVREQGAVPIPVDCYPVSDDVPVFEDVYWGYGQRNLRAAHQIRRTAGVFSLWCSNYACGPDSFCLHFYAYVMEGKPYAVIETDGHSGDAGTKTRAEAFLYCVRQSLEGEPSGHRPRALRLLELDKDTLPEIRRRKELVLIPRMGQGAETLAACLRGAGVRAEALPLPDREALELGRRHSSGKECVPMTITLGSLLQRLQRDGDSDELYSFFMPTAHGPCRFGVYHLLHKMTLERLGYARRVRVWSPPDSDYFGGVPKGFSVLAYTGFAASDLLLEMFYDARPAERHAGAAAQVYGDAMAELSERLEAAGRDGKLDLVPALGEVASGRLFGATELLGRTARVMAAIRRPVALPTVLVVGEIYVRCDPFANDFVIDRLEAQGVRVRFAPFTEWLEYVDHINACNGRSSGLGAWLSSRVQSHVQEHTYRTVARALGWPARTTVRDSLRAAAPYLRAELNGEAVLTLGGPLHEWHERLIDGVLSVGPLECMPSKIAEAQFFHAAEREGLLSLTLALNGDPIDPERLDGFVFEVKERFRRRSGSLVRRSPAALVPSFADRPAADRPAPAATAAAP